MLIVRWCGTEEPTTIYTIVYTVADADRDNFHNPEARGKKLPLASAQRELKRQIAAEKAMLDGRTVLEI